MNFSKRLAYFFVGLFIGIFFVVYFLNAKAKSRGVAFCYFPNCRVLQELRKKPFEISKNAEMQLQTLSINKDDLKSFLTNGDVDFSKSNKPFNNGKLYVIEAETTQGENTIITVVNYKDKVVLENISH